MKKFILTICVLATCLSAFAGRKLTTNENLQNCGFVKGTTYRAPATRASESMTFSLCDSIVTAYGLEIQAGSYVYLAFEIPTEYLKMLKGNKITAINICTGINTNYKKNPNTAVSLFLSHNLTSDPYFTQAGKTTSDAFTWVSIPLTEPQEIDDSKPLYVGYSFRSTSLTQYFMPTDALPAAPNNCIYANGNGQKQPQTWTGYGDQIGSVGISITVEGENLPKDVVSVMDTYTQSCYKHGDKPVYSVLLRNFGSNDISSITYKVKATGENEYTKVIDFSSPLPSMTSVVVDITGEPFATVSGKNVTIDFDKLGDNANKSTARTADLFTVCADETYPRKYVMEEATGTWCGLCPAGIVMMDYIKEKYGDKIYRVAAHNGDIMSIPSYSGWMNVFAAGVPSAFLNRMVDCAPTAPNVNQVIDAAIAEYDAVPTYIKMNLGGVENIDGGKKARAYTYTTFSADIEHPYAISAVVVENNVGPYNQTNYFSGGSKGTMGGWEKKENPVSTIYEDVARYLTGFPGTTVLRKIEKGQEYFFPLDLDLSKVKGEDYTVIYWISDAETGEILNAAALDCTKSGVKDVVSAGAKAAINVTAGHIEISGAANCAIYTLSGLKVANGSADVPAGLYIVKADNTVRKVLVK